MELLELLARNLPGVKISCQWDMKKYCLITNCYTDRPEEIKGSNGEKIKKYIECETLYIKCFSDDTWNLYLDAAKKCEEYYTGKDSIILRVQEPHLMEKRTPKAEFIDKIKQTEKRIEIFRQHAREKIRQCLEDLLESGIKLDAYEDEYTIVVWPDDCKLFDEWYNIQRVYNYNDGRTMMFITMHRETLLWKTLKEGGEDLCLLDRARQGPMEKIP